MKKSVLNRKCLVLNKTWTPVGTISLKKALVMLFSTYSNGETKARVVDPESYQPFTWEEWAEVTPLTTEEVIRSAYSVYRVPKVILLSRYERLPQPKGSFNRRMLYKRDKLTCQYCGRQPGAHELTIDHVTPRAQGGQTSWENTVLACVDCNSRKADRTPQQAGMRLLSEPRKPRVHLIRFDSPILVDAWKPFLAGVGDSD